MFEILEDMVGPNSYCLKRFLSYLCIYKSEISSFQTKFCLFLENLIRIPGRFWMSKTFARGNE